MTIYFFVDRFIPYLIKATLPFWALPYFTCMLVLKTINLWKSIICLIFELISPSALPRLVFAVVKGNGRYLRSHNEHVYVDQFYHYSLRSKPLTK